jgi:ligand-binding SRPBCC domain-containing protein
VPLITLLTHIHAPCELCFDLARSIDLHAQSLSNTAERAVAGITHGLIGPDQEVTWEATHFFIRQRLTSRIAAFDRPRHFRDSQVRGAFRRFDHDHFFESTPAGTTMKDVFDYTAPFRLLGRFADLLFLERYMRNLIALRARAIKIEAERQADRIEL